MNRLFSSSRPTEQISMPVLANMTPSRIQRVVDVNQIKHIHFGCVAIFSSTRLLIALVEFRPFTIMSEVKFNQWDELSQFFFCKKRFTNPIATNGALLEGFIFSIGWRKCSKKNEQFGLYGSVGKIEKAKDEWRNRGANLSLVCCILVHTPILTLLKAPKNAKNSLRLYRLPTIHMPILTLVKVANNADKFLRLCRLPTVHMPIVRPVQAPNNSHTNPYACAGAQQLTSQSLPLCRLPTTHTPILTLVKVPNNLNNSIHE
ncbi:hypothetical protein O181_090660 [Austropuccinia psidii MF-1]|uniref:Tet-like 2OG-Fe(II) oxygenase domain-containing protein n=1 Tax=Austropuccinia psidii MF-1 TaxID=1389203 RepID=A0A9Q3IW86_9BASI|nr:hypothetical protein [Austropuccinia psidii MF-1]